MATSVESGTLSAARKRWRDKQRQKGWAYRCVNGEHPDCGGYYGRTRRNTELPRPACTCPCHPDAERLFDQEEPEW